MIPETIELSGDKLQQTSFSDIPIDLLLHWNKSRTGKIANVFTSRNYEIAAEIVRRYNAYADLQAKIDKLVKAGEQVAATFIGLVEGSIGGQTILKLKAIIREAK